ncbi:MAG TPA: amino acid permease [Methanospirillum sp.]|nr:amino acid permease [Methanospirillum sp.]
MMTSIPTTASLRLPQIIALYIGSVLGSGILLLPGLTAEMAGPASLIAWIIMSLLAIPVALTLGLLSVRYPHSGGVSHFVSQAFNPHLGSLVGWFFLFSVIIGVPIIALTGSGYACAAVGLNETCRLIIAILILLTGVTANYIGMKLTGQIQVAVVVGTIVVLIAAIFGGVSTIDPVNFTPFMPYGWVSIGGAATLIFWCFLGWEAISHLTEEFEDPGRDVVKGTIISAIIISTLYIGAAVAVVGTHWYGSGISDVALIHLIKTAFGQYGVILTGFISLFICTAPAIAYIGAASRLVYSLSVTGYAPEIFSRLSPRFHTPIGGLWFLILCFAILLGVFSSGILSLTTLIQIPNATFILTYLGASAAGVILLKESRFGIIMSGISLLLTAIIFIFVGWAFLYPMAITAAWWGYIRFARSRYDIRPGGEA